MGGCLSTVAYGPSMGTSLLKLIQARIKGVAKELRACFSRDKPWLCWLNFALLFPQTFEVSGNVVSLVAKEMIRTTMMTSPWLRFPSGMSFHMHTSCASSGCLMHGVTTRC